MTATSMTRRAWLLTLLVLLGTLLSLSVPRSSASAATRDQGRLDWERPGSRVTLPNGWSLTTTTTPMVEVRDAGGKLLGVTELLHYPLGDRLAAATTPSQRQRVLRADAREFHRWVEADRAETFGDRYVYRRAPTRSARIGDAVGIRYRGTLVERASGELAEVIDAFVTIHAGQRWVFAAGGTVLFGDEGDLAPADAVTLGRYLGPILRRSPLPRAGTAITDGTVVGVDGGLHGGLVYVLLEGHKHRIQQPAALTEADVRALGLRYGRTIAQLELANRSTGSRFVVVPPDGPRAQLHLQVRDVLHPVVIQQVTRDTADSVPTGAQLAWDRLRTVRG